MCIYTYIHTTMYIVSKPCLFILWFYLFVSDRFGFVEFPNTFHAITTAARAFNFYGFSQQSFKTVLNKSARKSRHWKNTCFFAAGSPVAIVQGFVSQGKIEIFTTVSAALRNQKPFTKLFLKCPGRRNLDSKSGPVNNWAQAMGHGPRPRDKE